MRLAAFVRRRHSCFVNDEQPDSAGVKRNIQIFCVLLLQLAFSPPARLAVDAFRAFDGITDSM